MESTIQANSLARSDCKEELLALIQEEFEALNAVYEDEGVVEEEPALAKVPIS
jgi:hypothetical protein